MQKVRQRPMIERLAVLYRAYVQREHGQRLNVRHIKLKQMVDLMADELKWIAGVGVSVALAMFGHTIAAFRNVRSSQSKANADIYNRIREVENAAASKDDVKELRNSMEGQFKIDRDERRERDSNMRDFIKVTVENLKR